MILRRIVKGLAGLLAFVMILGVFLQIFLPDGKKVTDWFAKDNIEQVIPDAEQKDGTGATISNIETKGVKLMSFAVSPDEFETYGISTQAESGYVINATVSPSDATETTLDWSFAWQNPNSSWASGKAVGQYFALVTSNATHTASLSCGGAFGEPIIVTCASRENADIKATCKVDYIKRVQSVSLKLDNSSYVNFNTTQVLSYSVEYTAGTLQGTFTPGTVYFTLDSNLYSTCVNAVGSYSQFHPDKESTLYRFTGSETSHIVDMGTCKRFYTVSGDPTAIDSKWTKAFKEYIQAHPGIHGTLSMRYDYTYQGSASVTNTATLNVQINVDTVRVNVASISLDNTSIRM